MDVAFLTIAELNHLYDRRELSPVEVTQALLDRIAAHDGALHSFLLVTDEVALEQARAAERELMAGTRRGPLHGIPYALKDIIVNEWLRT
ncbi:MAG: amidase family protein, partial [Alphaproteobacteria bacterium]